MTDYTLAWLLCLLALILFSVEVTRLIHAERERGLLKHATLDDWLALKYPPTLTEAQIREFHAMRWDGD